VTNHYFSEQNIIFTNKSRSLYSTTITHDKNNLPFLENDTSNIIVHINDLKDFENNRKKRIWENLISNEN
jgi:hypothetical protein